MPAEGIRSTTHLQAVVAPPAPFSYLPHGVLVTVGEAAVHSALANLQVRIVCCTQLTSHASSCLKNQAGSAL